VGDSAEANPSEIGYWAAIHDRFGQCDSDWYDETAASRKAIKNRLTSIAASRGADAARAEYKVILVDREAHRDELDALARGQPDRDGDRVLSPSGGAVPFTRCRPNHRAWRSPWCASATSCSPATP
jgi:hypothetical protein